MRRAVIGLGSNLGDRAATIAEAIERLRADAGVRVLARSSTYESPPAGGPPQGDYLNAAVLIETSLPGREILERALAIERSLGRVRPDPVAWGPRTIDLDLLWIEGEVIDESEEVFPESEPIDEPTDGTIEEPADGETAVPPAAGEDVAEAEPIDYQLTRALDLLRGLALLSAQAAE